MTKKKGYAQHVAVFLSFSLVGFLLYYPILGNAFLSDDYDSLYRICIQKRIIFSEFLRPMIDISFYFNYITGGLSTTGFYCFNVLVHILNAYLLYLLAIKLPGKDTRNHQLLGWLGAGLFLVYPFHNESIAWLSGRLSSMACFFALLALLLSNKNNSTLSTVSALSLYIIGLLCYESIIVLPVIIIAWNWQRYAGSSMLVNRIILWFGVTIAYVLFRFWLSGNITGDYGDRLVDNHFREKLLNVPKVLGRLFLPPSENQAWLIMLTLLILTLLAGIHWWLLRYRQVKLFTYNYYTVLVFCLLTSLSLPIAFGVSTHTSEGDRLLYFPSAFFCIIGAAFILKICSTWLSRAIVAIFLIGYSIWFLEVNNLNWLRASATANAVLEACKRNNVRQKIFINLPEEFDGAFIFRNGFQKALVIHGADTSGIVAFNRLQWADFLSAPDTIVPIHLDNKLSIYPGTLILNNNTDSLLISEGLNKKAIALKKERNSIYFWNKHDIVPLF